MPKTNIRSRIDERTKREAQALFDKLGLTMSDAIRLFLRQVILKKGLPFEVRLPEYEDIEHDDWFRGQVEEALESADEPESHFVPHEQVGSRWAKKREELLAKNQKPANK